MKPKFLFIIFAFHGLAGLSACNFSDKGLTTNLVQNEALSVATETVTPATPIALPLVSSTPLVPNDSLFQLQWEFADPRLGSAGINGPGAWGVTHDCKSVTVAVIDTGIDFSHPDLSPNIFKGNSAGPGGWNFVAGNGNPQDDHYHGTHVSGTLGAAGNNGRGITGICWTASILPIKALDSTGSGTISDMVSAIDYAAQSGAKIINASWGGTKYSALLQNSIESASQAGVIVVTASGNGDASGVGQNNDVIPSYPANFSSGNIIAVAATDAHDQLSSFSNYGSTSVQIAAPGEKILSTFPMTLTEGMKADGYVASNQEFAYLEGTSMATPHVTAAIALLWAAHPSLSADQIKTYLLDRADTVPVLAGKVKNAKRLNLYNLFGKP